MSSGVIATENARPPFLALVPAFSFGVYGLIKSQVPLTAAAALTEEGLALVWAAPALFTVDVVRAARGASGRRTAERQAVRSTM